VLDRWLGCPGIWQENIDAPYEDPQHLGEIDEHIMSATISQIWTKNPIFSVEIERQAQSPDL
jgi:hypothetical protein